MKPNLAILGARGQLGRELRILAGDRGLAYRALTHGECDIADPDAVERAVSGCDVVVNCAAYTLIDKAETELRPAFHSNTTGAGTVAAACARVGAALVQISTDYVFDGSLGRPLREDDPVAPLNVYGRSKVAGEEAVRTQLATHIILRTSSLFASHGTNFVRTILRLADEGKELKVVSDQVGGPTAAADVSAAILHIVEALRKPQFSEFGTYHFCGAPAVSWSDFARAIVADRPAVKIAAVASQALPTIAHRPPYTYLDCARIGQVFGLKQPDWRTSLRRVIAQLRQA
jgi:dTDP-4-dehydrorhamnose reductase